MPTLSKVILVMNTITIIMSLSRALMNYQERKKITFQIAQIIVNLVIAFLVLKSNGYL